jgi:PAS domain S-box-containing protein
MRLEESAEDLYEHAPCGYLSTDTNGVIVNVNETFLTWSGYSREELVGEKRFPDILNAGGRIYYETHYAPLIAMQGAVREIAVDIRHADGSYLPALVNAVMTSAEPPVIRTTIFDARDRRRYEQELLDARRQEHRIAQQLQRSMLSGALPTDPRVELAVQYEAAGAGLEVGGDWYDAFWINDHDRVAIVVGDVVGKGIAAAATMGQLRSAVRALAATGLKPAALLEALDQFSYRHEVGLNTTLVYGELSLGDREFSWACAGHPPPLLVPAHGQPHFLWEGRSAPLDAHVGEAPPRKDGSAQLAPGDTVLLYTDGLVERRDAVIDQGMDLLLATARPEPGEAAPGLAVRVFEALGNAGHSDDTCLLVARLG